MLDKSPLELALNVIEDELGTDAEGLRKTIPLSRKDGNYHCTGAVEDALSCLDSAIAHAVALQIGQLTGLVA